MNAMCHELPSSLPCAAPVVLRLMFAATRGMALLLGAFTLLNVLGELRNPGFDANLWWIDLRFANVMLGRVAMLVTGLLLVVFGVRPTFAPLRGWGLCSWLGLLMLVAAFNSWTFLRLVSAGEIRSDFPLPLSGVMLIVLTAIFWAVGHREFRSQCVPVGNRGRCSPVSTGSDVLLRTNRLQADVIVVFVCHSASHQHTVPPVPTIVAWRIDNSPTSRSTASEMWY